MSTRLTHRRLVAAAAAAGLALALGSAPASADSHVTVVASGLDGPRLLTVAPTGDIYVAESGRGGSGPCATHPELGEFCFGYSGAITRVDPDGPDPRVVTGLPSIAGADDAIGPSGVSVTGSQKYVVSIGLGGSDELRAMFGPEGEWLASLLTGKLKQPGFTKFADVLGYEAHANPDGTDIDSNPTAILREGESYYVADAGGNSVVKANHKGEFRTTAVLDPVVATQPPFTGFPADAVPTALAKGPDDALYIGQLTGFPFEKGAAKIWRVVPGGTPTVYASGLTNVTSIAFDEHGSLYAVQIAADGLLAGPIGSLVKVTPGGMTHETVAGGLFAPYGVALTGGAAYVSTCSVCTGGGEVVQVQLH